MRVRVDEAVDAVYLNLTDRPIKDSEEIAEGIVVDYDARGLLVGIEILDASTRTDDPAALKQFSLELPTRRGQDMSRDKKTRGLDLATAEAAFERAAYKALHGTREERSGRFLKNRAAAVRPDRSRESAKQKA